jgi:hypothetical protein
VQEILGRPQESPVPPDAVRRIDAYVKEQGRELSQALSRDVGQMGCPTFGRSRTAAERETRDVT